ncbi:MAG: hypothetical protein N2510_07155 [Ignavibacteria bacterium]|nr:hypothetical protein [Ignavibacteria bacterium]
MNFNSNSFQISGSLALLQFSTEFQDSLDYISGGEALNKKYVDIREISESGSVNDILFKNISPYFIFFSDGDLLTGAKQNRVLNTSVFLKPESEKIIPVSCIERGRWYRKSNSFEYESDIIPFDLKKLKFGNVSERLRSSGKHYAYQSLVWDKVSEYSDKLRVESETEDLREILNRSNKKLDQDIRSFTTDSNSNGLVVFFNSEPVLVELYNRKDIYAEYFTKILKSVLWDYEPKHIKEKKELDKHEAERILTAVFNKVRNLNYETFPGAAEGTEKRYKNKFSFYQLEYNHQIVHSVIYT